MEKCTRIDHADHVFPGWGCCQCHAYNGYQRSNCRRCDHPHCYDFATAEILPIAGSSDHYNPTTRTIVPAATA
jgi:hypothetical protein